MTRCVSEEQRTFESLTLGHLDHLHRFGVHLTGNTMDADDLVQETYLKAFRHWRSFDPETNIRAWLFKILKNSFINLYRKQSTQGISVEYIEGGGPHGDGHRGASHSPLQDPVFSHLFDDEIAGALSALPDNCRTVLILSDIEGMAYEEIADFLHCPLGTVRSRLHRARRFLRVELAHLSKAHGPRAARAIGLGESRCAVGG